MTYIHFIIQYRMEQILNTNSELNRVGNLVSLFTYYVKEFFLIGFISNVIKIENKVDFKQGEEGFTWGGYSDLGFNINSDGELLIKSNEDKDFFIDINGNLVMEEQE